MGDVVVEAGQLHRQRRRFIQAAQSGRRLTQGAGGRQGVVTDESDQAIAEDVAEEPTGIVVRNTQFLAEEPRLVLVEHGGAGNKGLGRGRVGRDPTVGRDVELGPAMHAPGEHLAGHGPGRNADRPA